MNNELEIDRKAVQNDLERSANFGMVDTDDGIGRTVLTGTPANFAARNYFVDQLVTAGLDVSVDAVGLPGAGHRQNVMTLLTQLPQAVISTPFLRVGYSTDHSVSTLRWKQFALLNEALRRLTAR